MESDQKSVKPTKMGESEKEGSEARLRLIPSLLVEVSAQVKRPRPMTPEEAQWIADGKQMKVVPLEGR